MIDFVPERHMACRMTAIFLATATLARLKPARVLSANALRCNVNASLLGRYISAARCPSERRRVGGSGSGRFRVLALCLLATSRRKQPGPTPREAITSNSAIAAHL